VDSLIPILIVAAIVVFALVIVVGKGRLGPNVYQRKANVFSPAETQFLAVLDQAISPGQRVFGKVRVMDLVEMKPGLSPKARQAAVNRISQKHVDFLICAGPAMTPVCAVELNDSSHSSIKAQRRDQLLDSVCNQIGLPLVVVKAARSYDPTSVRQQITVATQSDGQSA
jgi:hypothetical protein